MSFFSSLLDLLFPPKCVFCGKVLGAGNTWCVKCESGLPFTSNGGRRDGEIYDFCIAPLYYEGLVRKSILRYKFRGASSYAGAYGKILAACVRDNLNTGNLNTGYTAGYDVISWVPLSNRRKRARGYDQAMLLALATALELGDVAVETLSKPHDVIAQSELSGKDERRANISGAYEAVDAELILGKTVLLIDDIVTTGSTLDECARILLDAGASRVVCAALARAE